MQPASIPVLLTAVTLALALMAGFLGTFIGLQTKPGSRAGLAANLTVLALDLLLLFAARTQAIKIGTLELSGTFLFRLAGQIAGAVTLAFGAGLSAGRRRQQSRAVWNGGFAFLLFAVAAVASGVYGTLQPLARTARELGLGERHKKEEPKINQDCVENLQSLYRAFSMYAQDWDALPPADRWMDNEEIVSKVTRNEWLHCPEVSSRSDDKFGYAYNETLASKSLKGKPLNEMPDAAKTPLLSDSTLLTKSAHDKGETRPTPGRHGGKNNVLYCDGHVEAVAP